jgi:hypothetical protein
MNGSRSGAAQVVPSEDEVTGIKEISVRKISTLAVMLALLAAPAAMAGEYKADKASCAKRCSQTADGKKCDPTDCKKSDKCTAEEKAKCAAAKDSKPEAPKAPAAPKS